MLLRLLQRTVNKGTARKKVKILLIQIPKEYTWNESFIVWTGIQKNQWATVIRQACQHHYLCHNGKWKFHRMAGDHDLKKRLYLQGQRWTDILECLGSILVAINMHIILFPLVLRRPRLTLKMNTYMIFKWTMTSSAFTFVPNVFYRFKRNKSPHNLIIALCIISGEVVFANCGPSCGARKSGFCKHNLALMLKICKYSLYNCKHVAELRHEADENHSTACTSTLHRWHQPWVEGIVSYPIMEVSISKTQLEGECKVAGSHVIFMKQGKLTGNQN